jgi:hypothetical protein
MSTQYRLVQSGKTASGGCSACPRFVRACSATDLITLMSSQAISQVSSLQTINVGGFELTWMIT